MAMITDDDLKMFQERSKTEFASRCDTGGIAWDSVIWDLCNEVRKLRGGDCAKLREALETLRELLGDLLRLEDAEYHNDFSNFCDIIDAALAEPPRNCDVYDSYGDAIRAFEDAEDAEDYEDVAEWLFAPATEKEGEIDGGK